jgi:hypothetical protein
LIANAATPSLMVVAMICFPREKHVVVDKPALPYPSPSPEVAAKEGRASRDRKYSLRQTPLQLRAESSSIFSLTISGYGIAYS